MAKSIYVICAVNMVASAVAIFLIVRAPAKSKLELPTPQNAMTKAAEPPPAPEVLWSEFSHASGMQAASQALVRLPGSDAMLEQAKVYIQTHAGTTLDTVDFAETGRVAACLHFLARHAAWTSPYREFLQSTAADRQRSVILRDIALRGVVDIALRQHSAKQETPDHAWRAELVTFLTSDFGSDTSMEGLALQATVFARNQGLVTLDNAALTERLLPILEQHATVHETTLLAAVETCATLPDAKLAEALRPVVRNPRSQAVLQTAVSTLGKIGSLEDRAWLGSSRFTSAPLYRVSEAAWLGLAPAGAGATAESTSIK